MMPLVALLEMRLLPEILHLGDTEYLVNTSLFVTPPLSIASGNNVLVL